MTSPQIEGVAAFLDLRDSTWAWHQYSDGAEEAIRKLRTIVDHAVPAWGGKVGNFTGDGFLLLFEQAERCVYALAEILRKWEAARETLGERFRAAGSPFPHPSVLGLRTGVAKGTYRALEGWHPQHHAGEVINRAQRCEAASKPFYDEAMPEGLLPWQRIFVSEGVYEQIGNKGRYHSSKQLQVTFKGYEWRDAVTGREESTVQLLRALWPIKEHSPSELARAHPNRMEQTGHVASNIDPAERRRWAEERHREGERLCVMAEKADGPAARDAWERAIVAFRDALRVFVPEAWPAERVRVQSSLGDALRDYGGMFTGDEGLRYLDESSEAYRDALRLHRIDDGPGKFASLQHGLGLALHIRALESTGDARVRLLGEAVTAYREVARAREVSAELRLVADAQDTIGILLLEQASLLEGPARSRAVGDAIAAFEKAAQVFTPTHYPAEHRSLMFHLREARRLQSRVADEG